MLTLYHYANSVCSQKVRLALAETGLAWEGRDVVLPAGEQFDPTYLKLNPEGVVPTLVHDGVVIRESSLIAEYLDRLAGGKLMPEKTEAEFATRLWLLRTLSIHEAINTMSFSTAYRAAELEKFTPDEIEARLAKMPNPQMAAKRRDLFKNGVSSVYVAGALFTLNRMLADMSAALAKGPWLMTAGYGLADIALLAYVDRLQRLGMDGLWADRHAGIADWLAASQARPSYATAISDYIPPDAAATFRASGSVHWPALEAILKGVR